MDNQIGLPTLGELLRYAYKAFGVLPSDGDADFMSDKERATTNRAASRLAKEEGELVERYDQLIKTLSALITDHLSHPGIHMAVGDVLIDLLESYRNVIRTEGSFLSKRDSLRWLIRDRWISVVAVSLARRELQWGLGSLKGALPPADAWFLPDFQEGVTVWPMRKALAWLYDLGTR